VLIATKDHQNVPISEKAIVLHFVLEIKERLKQRHYTIGGLKQRILNHRNLQMIERSKPKSKSL
jgi:hypothetical protein